MEPFFTKAVDRWDVFEWSCHGPTENNPFTEQWLKAEFSCGLESLCVDGFYDGDGVYRVRFMPSREGTYRFRITTSFPLENAEGTFTVGAPQAGRHGPVRVADTWRLVYEDGTPYLCLGTTCYVWALQSDELVAETLQTLSQSAFTKIRFCIFPKHYAYNLHEPYSYPFIGTPMDSSVLTDQNFGDYNELSSGNEWDFTRFNPAHFQRLERCIQALGRLGIEADLILFHPYDRWGFSCMPREADLRYLRYVIARFSAYHNVWWSLANEYDLMKHKTLADWEKIAQVLCENDPYRHLRSIHNCFHFYDYNRPWITHCSIQRNDLYKSAELTNQWRERYRKPVVLDEIAYEGNIQYGWGNLTGEEMTRRFWEGALRGGYPGHGETFLDPSGILWWSHGGTLHGDSPARIRFLTGVLRQVPEGLQPNPEASWDEVGAVSLSGTQYLYYYSFMRPGFRDFHMEGRYAVTVYDTWNMTEEDRGVYTDSFRIQLPGRPYMAIRLQRQ